MLPHTHNKYINDCIIKINFKMWDHVFQDAKPELDHIFKMLDKAPYYPDKDIIFNAFNLCPLQDIKVILMGQEPYKHNDVGLSFGVDKDAPIPLLLKRLFQELKLNGFNAAHGDLSSWAKQGVLLINHTLTCGAKSHAEYELWYGLFNKVFKAITKVNPSCIVVLMGYEAQKIKKILPDNFIIIETCLPTHYKYETDFLKCNLFININKLLVEQHKQPIDWNID